MRALSATPSEAARHGLPVSQDGLRRTAFELLSYPSIDWAMLERLWPELGALPEPVQAQIEADAKYAVYLDRQAADIERSRREESAALDPDFDYGRVAGPVARAARQARRGPPDDARPGAAPRRHDPRRHHASARPCARCRRSRRRSRRDGGFTAAAPR